MSLKAGDRVRFLNDVGEGIIKRILEKGIALVENNDGFEIPVPLRELVPVSGIYEKEIIPEPEQKANEKNDPVKRKNQIPPAEKNIKDEEVALAFVPLRDTPELQIYLINSSSYNMFFTVASGTGKIKNLIGKGQLEPGLKIYLGKFMPENLNSLITFTIQVIFFKNNEFSGKSPVELVKNIPATNLLSGEFRVTNDYFDNAAFFIQIENFGKKEKSEKNIVNPEELRNSLLSKKHTESNELFPEKKSTATLEIDLHIDKLSDKYQIMSPAEIIELQTVKFRTSLESALMKGFSKVIFIHGVGNGKLKYEIRRILDQEYRGMKYQDASFREYGYGATMVCIK